MTKRWVLLGLFVLGLPGWGFAQSQIPRIGRAPTFGGADPNQPIKYVPIDVEALSVVPLPKRKVSWWQRLGGLLPTMHQRKDYLGPADVGLTPVMTKKKVD
jgi:hypothetical protein